jgi:hypothetical protein
MEGFEMLNLELHTKITVFLMALYWVLSQDKSVCGVYKVTIYGKLLFFQMYKFKAAQIFVTIIDSVHRAESRLRTATF